MYPIGADWPDSVCFIERSCLKVIRQRALTSICTHASMLIQRHPYLQTHVHTTPIYTLITHSHIPTANIHTEIYLKQCFSVSVHLPNNISITQGIPLSNADLCLALISKAGGRGSLARSVRDPLAFAKPRVSWVCRVHRDAFVPFHS